ncbi:tubulin polyglutamylase complex subunit 2 [Sinocyclocheilus anshuiensis]|uniref:Knr4/Smi1-like domain-containing protein n=1 Tax=Sinocyclocheilus anshuiensis TaxID=1608454 RepID=A0A671QR27_9TELE|nr:PREDICTED: tubulin polyglutamylase complex subunit 2 [Sinocyclocheilus anshuiensis]
MEEVKDDKTCKGFVDRLTLGIIRVLENLPGVLDVRFVEKPPAEKRCLLSWEQKNNCALPEDLRDFYLTTDGFMLAWNNKLEDEVVPVGCMMISSVAQLRPLIQSNVYSLPNAPTLADLDFDDDLEESDGPEKPHFDSRSRIFELDPCNGNGKVCLVYKNCTSGVMAQQCEVWFLDRSLFWHYLTPSFTAYYRLMITHLGLPEWQYNFTPYGPSPQAKQWAALYQPLTFHGDSHSDTAGEPLLNKLDPAKAFRGKAKPPTPKKKQAAQVPASGGSTAKAQGVSGRHSVTKR